MIRCLKKHLEARCRERGYTLEEVRPCIAAEHKDGTITVDETHPSYPRARKKNATISPPASSDGRQTPRPGAKLKSLLKSWLGVSASPNCSCNARARAMDDNEAREPGWCEKNIDEIVGWLEEEARKRRLPFVRYAAKLLVRRAIRLAYKEAKT